MENEHKLGKNILLVITGSIAAVKVPELIKLLLQQRYNVETVVTYSAQKFITPDLLSALTHRQVNTELFTSSSQTMPHITLSKWADLIVIYPATAHFLANIAHGMAGDLAQSIILSTTSPVVAAPAMNPHMWSHPATQKNIHILQEHHLHIIPPCYGKAACGDVGIGHIEPPQQTIETIDRILNESCKNNLTGLHALVTAGPTREYIDPIRFLTNASSGLQGYHIAQCLAHAGADVTLISGPCNLPVPTGVNVYMCNNAREMASLVKEHAPYDIAICTAAVSDYRPQHYATQKIKKERTPGSSYKLELTRNPDILKDISSWRRHRPQLVIGFAAETQHLVDNARDKLHKKRCDWIIANQIGTQHNPMGDPSNQVTLVSQKGSETWPKMDKAHIARKIVDAITSWHQRSSKSDS